MPEPSIPTAHIVKFGVFELNVQSGELRKSGTRIRLQEQPLRTLVLLLERPGDLVTRDDLRSRLWPDDTFVDFEHGLNAAINRLRETLGDSADVPRFVETVPRRGYRFIAPVEQLNVPGNRSTESGSEIGAVNAAPSALAGVPVASSDEGASTRRLGWWTRLGAPLSRGKLAAIAATAALTSAMLVVWLLPRSRSVDGPVARVVSLTTLVGIESEPAFAPDGDQVAFVWSGEKGGNTDIYITLVGSTDVRRLTTHPAHDLAPTWSPDGRRVAFVRKTGHTGQIHVISSLGGSDAKLSDFPVGIIEFEGLLTGARITWSPDGRYVVAGRDPRFTDGVSAGLHLVPVQGGQPRALTRPRRTTFDFAPAFSVDGRHVAYVSCEHVGLFLPSLLPDRCAVRVIEVDTTLTPTAPARTLTSRPVDFGGVAWSRDGRSIVFVSGAPGPKQLWRLPLDKQQSAEPIELAGTFAESPATAISRDRLAFARSEWDAHLYRFNADRPAEPVAASSSFEGDPRFSPDGRRLAFVSGRSGNVAIWIAAADGSNARQLTHRERQWPGSPAWSPDGRSIAFDAGDVGGGAVHIWIVDAEGGTPRQLTDGPGHQTVPTWSHDGQWIYFSGHQQDARNIWRVRATGGQPEQVTRTGSGFLAYELAVGSLLFQPVNGDSPLLLMPLAGSSAAPRRLVDCVRNAAFVPVRRMVAYVACDSSSRPPLHVIDPHSGRDTLLGRLEHSPPGAMHVNLAATPDGNTILYRGMVRHRGDLMMIENFR